MVPSVRNQDAPLAVHRHAPRLLQDAAPEDRPRGEADAAWVMRNGAVGGPGIGAEAAQAAAGGGYSGEDEGTFFSVLGDLELDDVLPNVEGQHPGVGAGAARY